MPVEFQNFDQIKMMLQDIGTTGIDEARSSILDRLGNRLIELINERWNMVKGPKSTGKYISEWAITERGQDYVQVSNPDTELFIILEFTGSIPHDIIPHGDYPLHWSDELGEHFAMHVKHPGFPAKPHVLPAEDDLTHEHLQIISDELKQFLPFA